MPYLKCIDEKEAKYILKEIHEGVCGNHAGPRSLVAYYASGREVARQEVQQVPEVWKCPMPSNKRLMTISSPWPFTQ